MLPAEVTAMRVSRVQFVTPQHYEAWLLGMPLRRHLSGRKKLTREIKDAYFAHHPYRCAFCGKASLLTLDHIVPSALGGASCDANYRAACLSCNVKAFAPFRRYLRLLDQYEAGIAA
jgi:hypothetical protein